MTADHVRPMLCNSLLEMTAKRPRRPISFVAGVDGRADVLGTGNGSSQLIHFGLQLGAFIGALRPQLSGSNMKW